MKSREILSLEDRYVIQLNPANSELLTKCWKALQIAEEEIEEKVVTIKELWRVIDIKNSNLESKDKEIAELSHKYKMALVDIISVRQENTNLKEEISSLKEEIERLKGNCERCKDISDDFLLTR